MFKFTFSKKDYEFELPETYEEESLFYLSNKYSLPVFLNREFMRFKIYAIAGESGFKEFSEQIFKWFEIYKENCPRHVHMQITRRDPDTFAVCIKDTWIKLKYMPSLNKLDII